MPRRNRNSNGNHPAPETAAHLVYNGTSTPPSASTRSHSRRVAASNLETTSDEGLKLREERAHLRCIQDARDTIASAFQAASDDAGTNRPSRIGELGEGTTFRGPPKAVEIDQRIGSDRTIIRYCRHIIVLAGRGHCDIAHIPGVEEFLTDHPEILLCKVCPDLVDLGVIVPQAITRLSVVMMDGWIEILRDRLDRKATGLGM